MPKGIDMEAMLENANNQKVMLPFWLKMFSSNTLGSFNIPSKEEETPSNLSHESLSRIAKILADDKSVILMSNGKPFKVFWKDNQIKVEEVTDFEFK